MEIRTNKISIFFIIKNEPIKVFSIIKIINVIINIILNFYYQIVKYKMLNNNHLETATTTFQSKKVSVHDKNR